MNIAKFDTNLNSLVQYNSEGENIDEAFASVSLNPSFVWAKFILTDDLPNKNKQRVPKSEFANLVKTGIHAPIKMGIGEVKPGHEEATPVGVITHLKETGNKIEGLAAFWTREREGDIATLKKMYSDGNPPQLSWEIMYEDLAKDDEGVETLQGTALRAATIVGMPAYAGRTSIVAMASEIIDNSEVLNVEELEQLKAELETIKASLTAKETELASLNEELSTLREFKASIDKEQEVAKKFGVIKSKFESAGLKKDENYFTDKKELLLGLTEPALDFMIQELVAGLPTASASTGTQIPVIVNNDAPLGDNVSELAKILLQKLSK